MIEESAYLLQNQLNPFPIAGELELSDEGRLPFSLTTNAAQASLAWLEKALGTDELKARIESGEKPLVFDLDVSGRKITWPASLARVGMKIEDDGRSWFISLEYPSGGAIWQTLT